MAITRRDFLKYSAAVGGGLLLGIGLFDLKPIKAYADASPPAWHSEAITVCGYCSVGCSMIVGSDLISGKPYVTYVQGNSDSPINKGALCSKGQASVQFSTIPASGIRIPNSKRLTGIKYRAAYAPNWDQEGGVDKLYSWTDEIPGSGGKTAIQLIAKRVQDTRDTANFKHTEMIKDRLDNNYELTVNRCEDIASLGAAALNNESCYLITKLMRSLGVVYLEHQARV